MQGPVDETDNNIQKNMVSSHFVKKFGKHSMSRKVHMRGESGACKMCSAPCSSCMHFNRALMGSKSEEFSDETCRVNSASQYSINLGDTSSSFKSKACDSLQHTTNETSNLFSVNSSHDFLSENAERKEPIRSSGTVECFEMFPNTYKNSKVVEVDDDNIMCVGRANDANVAVNDHKRNVERMNFPCSLASIGSVGQKEMGEAHKSALSEIVKDADAGNSAPKGKLRERCGLTDSSLTKEAASDIVAGQKFVSYKGLGVSTNICSKAEVETDDDGQDSKDEALRCLDHSEQDVKSSELVEVADMPPLQSASGDDSDKSDIVEHDVKVCDICGDAGREDMLAMCSRCSDGAEHIYCMRKMMRSVPKGHWLCEECKFAEETDNQKQGSVEGKRMDKAILSTQISDKKLAENIEVASAAKRQALVIRVGSPKPSSPKRMVALSRDSSFKNIDKDRLRSTYQTSQSTNDISETARSPSSSIRLQTAKGTLLKSNSFNTINSKSKVKLVDEGVPRKQKVSKEHASLDMKERAAKMMGKSVSFKSACSGGSNMFESKVKMLSPKFTHGQDLKGLKQAKERSTIERKNLSKPDRTLDSLTTVSPIVSTPKIDPASRGETSLLSSVSNNRESKAMLPDGKLSSLTRKGVETQIASVGASLMNGMFSSASEQKSNQVRSKDEPLSSYSCTGEMTNQVDKTRESSVRCSLTVTDSPKGVFCSKCKEIGHTWEFCRVGNLQASSTDASAPRSSGAEMQRGNRLKDAIHAALLRKPEIYRNKRVFDQSDELSTSNMDISYEVTSQEQSLLSNKSNNIMCTEGSHDGQAILGTSTSDSHKTTVHLKQLTVQPMGSVYPSKVADSVSVVPSRGRPTMKDLQSHASVATSVLVKTTAIPEYEYIWLGSFEVQRGGSFFDLCGGVQAHLSTYASPKVLEVVNKFPHKVPLNEVPRLSVWPSQFHQSGAKEDNIALYFFAKDVESYERHYRSLLDAMIKNDLALKGNLDGVELLIFPSNQLPESSQRWNMLYFLWGVFRTMRVHSIGLNKKTCVPGMSNSLDKDAPSVVMTLSKNPPKHIDDSFASDRSFGKASASNASLHMGPTVSKVCESKDTYPEEVHSGSKVNLVVQDNRLDSNTTNGAGFSEEVECTTPSLQEICLQGSRPGAEIKSSILTTGSNSSDKGERMQVHWVTSVDREHADSSKICPVSNQEVAAARSGGDGTIPDRKKRAAIARGVEEVILDRVNIEEAEFKQERELKGDYGYKETEATLMRDSARINCQSNNRKHPLIDLSETVASAATEVNTTQIDGESDSKKPKIISSGLYGFSTSRGTNVVDLDFVSHNDLGPFFLAEEKRCVDACEEKVIPEDLGTTERYFFPVDSRNRHHLQPDDNSVPWSEVEDKSRDRFPSLELALGAETKPQNKGMLPFFVGLADEKDNQDKPLEAVVDEKDDDVSASLSLSLSFPFPDKGQPVKPVSKSEQLLPERHCVNTSLLLFGRFPEK